MALCRVTGTLYVPSGEPAASYVLYLARLNKSVIADYNGSVVPDVVRVPVGRDGSVDFDILTGTYYGIARPCGSSDGFSFNFAVPNAPSVSFSMCIDALPPDPPLPAWLQLVEQAVAASEAALDDIASAQLRKNNLTATRAPLPSDGETQGYEVGSRWLWQGQEWVAADVTAGSARWAPAHAVARAAFSTLSAAVAARPNESIAVNYDDQALPADFSGSLLEYTNRATARKLNLKVMSEDQGLRTLRSQHPAAHPDIKWSTLNIETLATGSGKNGPNSSDYGATIAVAKKDYFSSDPAPGEIDGLTIYVRQDGPKGHLAGSPGASDAAGILLNVQNVGNVGWLGAIEGTTSSIDPTTAAITHSIQTQMGVYAGASEGGPLSYGFVAMSKAGEHNAAFYASETGGTFANILYSPGKVAIGGSGDIKFRPTDFSNWLGRIARASGVDGTLQITQTGTGGISIINTAATSITFSTDGKPRVQVLAGGALAPAADLGANLGTSGRRWSELNAAGFNVSGGLVTMSSLPVHADNAAALAGGLTAGRVYRSATGQLMVTY